MIIKLFDIENGVVVPTEHCYTLKALKDVSVASIIGSNPVFILGNNEYRVASFSGNILYTAILFLL